jgi:hypothetical protein
VQTERNPSPKRNLLDIGGDVASELRDAQETTPTQILVTV